MENKKLTPMMEFIEWMNTPADVIKDGLSAKQKANELLEKERQMVIDAWLDGGATLGAKNAEQYYNETFKTK